MSIFDRGTAAVLLPVLSALLLVTMPWPAAAQSPPADPAALRQEIEQLRKELDELKGRYESRLADLEAKLAASARRADRGGSGSAATPAGAAGYSRGTCHGAAGAGRVERVQPLDGRDRQLPRRGRQEHGQSRAGPADA